jgi:hypothetical protein
MLCFCLFSSPATPTVNTCHAGQSTLLSLHHASSSCATRTARHQDISTVVLYSSQNITVRVSKTPLETPGAATGSQSAAHLHEVRPPLQQLLLRAARAPCTHLLTHTPEPLQAVCCESIARLDRLQAQSQATSAAATAAAAAAVVAAAAAATAAVATGLQVSPTKDDQLRCGWVVHLPAHAARTRTHNTRCKKGAHALV